MNSQNAHATAPANPVSQAAASVSPARAWYAVSVLLVAYIFSIMDRQILTLLVGPIQKTLGVNDTLIGLLHGFTFAAFYGVMGLPIARLIDRGNRRVLIAIGIVVWSLATAASGLASDYWHLLAARIAVAVGEAVLIPGTVSLVADLFTPDKRGRAMGVFGAAGPVGSGVGLFAGSLILGAYTLSQPVLPFVGAIEPWQATFIAVGLPGVAVAIFMLAVPEPRAAKKAGMGGMGTGSDIVNVPVAQVKDYIVCNGRTFRGFIVGASMFYMSVYGFTGWAPTYFVRHFGWNYQEIGKLFGMLMLVAGPAGTLFASWLGDRWIRRGVVHGYLRVAILGVCGITASGSAMVLAATATPAAIFLGLVAFFVTFLFGIGPAIVTQITPAPMRGQVAALFTGALNLLGAGLGPVAIGLITDYVLGDRNAIGSSMLIVLLGAGTLAFLLLRSGISSYGDSVKHAARWCLAHEPQDLASADTRTAQG
ncbi:spinster family MFS transporter [Cupriavidus metallidurans]|uniref:spinster family MFS transporter n=1 Tax=Cupriavidus metallidurans TaxID=119219 RepID=UPI001BFCA052|nr:MFS transporter [Cupriavidus metallidurans]QWC91229.1 MFS transporter [Cupriavidus metallidurans]